MRAPVITREMVGNGFGWETWADFIDPRDYGAVGNGVADDTVALQYAIDAGRVINLTSSIYFTTASLVIPSDRVFMGNQITILSTAVNIFTFASGVANVEFNNLKIQGEGADSGQTAFDINGLKTSYATTVHELKFNNISVFDVETAINAFCLRKTNFDNCKFSVNKGLYYTSKSAEVGFTGCYFVQSGTLVGSYGIKTEADGADFPEGLLVTDTLLYQFERNRWLRDIYVARFSHCFIDNKDGTPDLYDYNVKCQEIKSSNNWYSGFGVQVGLAGYGAPKRFRAEFLGDTFQQLQPHVVIDLQNYAHDIMVADCDFIATVDVGNRVGVRGVEHNQEIVIDNLKFDTAGAGFDRYVQFLTSGANNKISNIVNSCALADPIFLEYPVNISNVEGYLMDFLNGDVTPSVGKGNIFKTANAGATIITMLDDGVKGETVTVIFGDAVTTIDFTGTNLKGNAGVDWTPAINDHMTCTFDGVNWYCDISDNTA